MNHKYFDKFYRKKEVLLLLISILSISSYAQKGDLQLIEAESFTNKGGWVIDQQSMDMMGSPYLMAHGMGVPVKDAETTVSFSKTGNYWVFVRTRNWAAPWFLI